MVLRIKCKFSGKVFTTKTIPRSCHLIIILYYY